MWNATRRVVLVTLAIGTVCMACGQQNPILGSWELDEERSDEMGRMAAGMLLGSGSLEFSDDRVSFGGQAQAVTYEIQGETITMMTNQGQGTVFTLTEDDRLLFPHPSARIVLRRTE